MLTASTQYDVTVNGRAMILAKQVTMTMPGGAALDVTAKLVSVSIDEATDTDMPAGTRAVVGYPSRSMDFTITDTDGVFDPTNSASPLFGLEMHYLAVQEKEGLYAAGANGVPELLTKFTGSTHAWKRNSASKTVTFTCLDGRDRLRSQAVTPAVVTPPPYNQGLTSEFVIDALLRAASVNQSISSWPARRAQCVLAVGFRSSISPEVGTQTGVTADPPSPTFAPGKFGTGLHGMTLSTYSYGNLYYLLAAPVTTTVFMEFWVTNVGTVDDFYIGVNSSIGSDRVALHITSSGVAVNAIGAVDLSGAQSTPITNATWLTGSHYVAMQINVPANGGKTWTGTLYLDGASQPVSVTAPTGRVTTNLLDQGFISNPTSTSQCAVEAWQVTTETSAALNNGFVPGAVLDPSLNTLQVVPAIADDPFQVITGPICNAEQATAGFDEAGVFRFKNRKTLRTSPSVRTVTASNLLPIDPESDSSAKATRVQVGYTPWSFGAPQTIWSATTALSFPAGRVTTKVIELDGLVTSLDATFSVLPDGSSGTAGLSYYRASVDTAGTRDHPGGFTVTASLATSSRLAITVDARKTKNTVVFVSSADHTDIAAGTPMFEVGGVPVMAAAEVLVDAQWPPLAADGTGGAVTNPAGEILQSITGNQWIQDENTANRLCVDLLAQLHRAPILLQNVQITPPDVRLQLSDRIRLIDPVSGIDEYVTIWGQQRELAGGSGPGDPLTYTHTLDARMVSGRFKGWILGVSGRTKLGTETRI